MRQPGGGWRHSSQRLAALVPRPRLHLIRVGVRITSLREVSGPPLREHGVLAPNAKLRAQIVPQDPESPTQAAQPAQCEANCAHHRPVRLSWAKLLKRVFDLDLEHCPNCGGELKIIAAILEQPVIEKILTQLGLQARAPPRAPARLPLCRSHRRGHWHWRWAQQWWHAEGGQIEPLSPRALCLFRGCGGGSPMARHQHQLIYKAAPDMTV